jgi:hypothetical protein
MGLADRMDRRVTIERYDDDAEDWFPIAAPAEVAAEVVALGQEQYRIAIRYRADFTSAKDAEPTARILWGHHTLDVLDVTETVRGVEVQILAKGRQIPYDNLETGARRKASWP